MGRKSLEDPMPSWRLAQRKGLTVQEGSLRREEGWLEGFAGTKLLPRGAKKAKARPILWL